MRDAAVLDKPQVEKSPIPLTPSVIRFMTNQEVGPNVGINVGPYRKVDGYRHINFFVEFTQTDGNERPVHLGFVFAFDETGTMGSRRFVNIEENTPPQQMPQFVDVSGANSWHGPPHNVSRFAARSPVMAPFVEVFVYNDAPVKRRVSVWGYVTP